MFQLWLSRNLPLGQICPKLRHPPASTSQVLGVKVVATRPGYSFLFVLVRCFSFNLAGEVRYHYIALADLELTGVDWTGACRQSS